MTTKKSEIQIILLESKIHEAILNCYDLPSSSDYILASDVEKVDLACNMLKFFEDRIKENTGYIVAGMLKNMGLMTEEQIKNFVYPGMDKKPSVH